MKKRIISFALVLCLLLGLLPMTAFAADGTELNVEFNKIPIGQAYMTSAQIMGAKVTGATRLDAELQPGEDGRVHIQVDLASGTPDGTEVQVNMSVSKGSASGIGFVLKPDLGAPGVGQDDTLNYTVPIENGRGQMQCYSYYSGKYTTLVLDFVVGEEAGNWTTPYDCKTNNGVLTGLRVWDEPVLKSYFKVSGKAASFAGANGDFYQLIGYIWLEDSVADDAIVGLQTVAGGGRLLDLPFDWTSNGGYVQLENGAAKVEFNAQGLNPGPVGTNYRVTLYITNYLSHEPEITDGTDQHTFSAEVDVPYVVDFAQIFSDQDAHDTLTYMVSVDGGEAKAQNGSKYRYTPGAAGLRTLVVTATDGFYTSEPCTIRIWAATEHVWGEWTVVQPASCTEDGQKTHTCTCCYEKETVTIPASGNHNWDEWIIKEQANCKEDGLRIRTCADCGAVEREAIPAGEHDWIETTTATCGQAGVKTETCPGCGETKTSEAPATGEHTWGAWEQTTAPTCGDAGQQTRTCSGCGGMETKSVDATGIHNWDVWKQTVAPSCQEGQRQRTCPDCGAVETAPIAANGNHVWGDWKITVEPTAETIGTETRTCDNCGATEDRKAYFRGNFVYVSISDAGNFKMTMEEVPLEDCDGDDRFTVNDVLYMAHVIAAPNGADDYGWNADQGFVTELWGSTQGCGYLKNQTYCWDIWDEVKSGDVVDAFLYSDQATWSDYFCYFDKQTLEVKAGESFTLNGMQIRYAMNGGGLESKPASEFTIYVDGKQTEYKMDSQGNVTLTLDEGGRHIITADHPMIYLVPPICVVDVDSNQVKLDAPVLTGAQMTGSTVTVTPPDASLIDPEAAVEYAISADGKNWGNWQQSNVFGKLSNSTTYYLQARYVSSNQSKFITSDASAVLQVKTNGGPSAVYTFADTTVQAGQIVEIPVNLLCEAENVWKWNVALDYDTGAFTLMGVEPGQDAGDWNIKLNRTTGCVYGTLPMGESVDGFSGELFILKLRVSQDAAAGKYDVTLKDTWNLAGNNAFWDANRAYVTVTGEAKGGTVAVNASQSAEDVTAFADVSASAWYSDDAAFVAREGLMQGTGSNRFSPNETASRAMLVTVLYRMEGEPAVSDKAVFQDVAEGTWYADAVAWAYENGIVNGVSDTAFAPNENVSRQQTAAILYRYAAYHGVETTAAATLTGYQDSADVSGYAELPMRWAVAEGILQGANGALNPNGDTTRAQLAAILNRYLSE